MLKLLILTAAILLSFSNVFGQQTVTVSQAEVDLRGRPDQKGKVIVSVKKGEVLELLMERGDWSLVQSEYFVGWIPTSSVSTARYVGTSRPDIVTNGQGGGMGAGLGSGTGTGRGSGQGSGVGSGSGIGSGTGSDGSGIVPSRSDPPKITRALRILSKPRAIATDEARRNKEEGTVVLRVTFLASGQIGSISVVKGLRFGLNEQAVAAARLIRFDPEMSNGVAKTVVRRIEYSFHYY